MGAGYPPCRSQPDARPNTIDPHGIRATSANDFRWVVRDSRTNPRIPPPEVSSSMPAWNLYHDAVVTALIIP
jgi:hypothetical protein